MVKFTTTINAFTKEVRIKAGEVCFEIQFTDLDEWYSFEFEGEVYDVHFHYDEKLWFNIYRNVKTEGYEKNIIKNDIRIVLTDLEFINERRYTRDETFYTWDTYTEATGKERYK